MQNNILSPYLEWQKWLNYEPSFEKERINVLTSLIKPTLKELNELRVYEYYHFMAQLFNNKNNNENEKLKILDFIQKEPLEPFILKKLTKDEIIQAKITIAKNSLKSFNELQDLINEMISNYSNLTMLDAYILHLNINLLNLKSAKNYPTR